MKNKIEETLNKLGSQSDESRNFIVKSLNSFKETLQEYSEASRKSFEVTEIKEYPFFEVIYHNNPLVYAAYYEEDKAFVIRFSKDIVEANKVNSACYDMFFSILYFRPEKLSGY